MRQTDSGKPSVFLGPLEISGYYGNLERGLREIGVAARLVTLHPNPYGFEQAERNPLPARLAVHAVLIHRRAPTPLRIFTGGLYLIACLLVLAWSLPRFDSYIFAWGESLLPRNLDLPVLRLFCKKITVVLGHGSEARPPYMSTPLEQSPPFSDRAFASLNAETRAVCKKVRRIECWAHTVIGLPTTGQFFRQPFINFYSLGLPTPAPAAAQESGIIQKETGRVRVLHVPSKPLVKGSLLIRQCMEVLTSKYPFIDYVELTDRPHAEILEAIERATFVVDQVWSDIPMAVVGTEAASLGKATIIGGYSWRVWQEVLAAEDWPPTVLTTPECLLETIESCILDPASMVEIGARARAFVETRWSCSTVAANYMRLLRGETPRAWLVDPSGIDYGYGCGVSRSNVNDMVLGLVERYGFGSLRWSKAQKVYDFNTT